MTDNYPPPKWWEVALVLLAYALMFLVSLFVCGGLAETAVWVGNR